jgi:CHAT domain-containing protein
MFHTSRPAVLFVIAVCAVIVLESIPSSVCDALSDPVALQQRGIKRIDNFIDQFRKTGDRVTLLGELQKAAEELSTSYEAFTRSRDLGAAALSLIKLGDIQRIQDKWQQAVNFYDKAYELAQQASHRAHQAKARMGRARAEASGLRDYGAAAAHIEEAVQLSAALEDKGYLFDALDLKAQIQVSRGDLIAAADTLNRAFTVAELLNDQSRLFYGHLDRAEIYQKLAEKCDYQRTFEPCYQAFALSKAEYERAYTLAKQLGYEGLARETMGFLRRLEARRELIQSQERFHKQLLQQGLFHPKKPSDVLVHELFISGSQHIPAGLFEHIQEAGALAAGDTRSLYIQGLFHEMQGDNDAALAAYLKAVTLLEVDRRQLRDEQSRGTFLEDKIEFYYTPILHLLERRRVPEAFELLERSRSRAMADLLASKKLGLSRPADRELYAASVKLRADIALLQKELFTLRSRADREQFGDKITTTEQAIQRLEGEHRQLLGRMAREAPRLPEILVSEPVSLQTLQQSMRQERYEVLYYLVLESAVILWHINDAAVHVRSVFLPRSELITKVESLRQSLTDRNVQFDQQTAREMFLFLIQPVLQWVQTDRLVIIPHENLHYLPFQVLQDPTSNKYVGERFQVSYAPSATILAGLKKPGSLARGKLLAVADPGIGEAQKEVEAIARLYPGSHKAVTDVLIKETDLKAWVGDYTLLHLSVHGRFRPQEPLLSHLQLSKGGADDGELTAAEIFGLPLEKTRLVVLSACETGRAEATHANEILGMVRALLYAGANALILSSWRVDAASTALWMETFYKEAQTRPVREAARLALVAVQQHPQYSHPYYWGAFLLIGG